MEDFIPAMFSRSPSLCDLESLDAEFHKSLLWIKDADGSDLSELDLTFSVDEEVRYWCCFYYLVHQHD